MASMIGETGLKRLRFIEDMIGIWSCRYGHAMYYERMRRACFTGKDGVMLDDEVCAEIGLFLKRLKAKVEGRVLDLEDLEVVSGK